VKVKHQNSDLRDSRPKSLPANKHRTPATIEGDSKGHKKKAAESRGGNKRLTLIDWGGKFTGDRKRLPEGEKGDIVLEGCIGAKVRRVEAAAGDSSWSI